MNKLRMFVLFAAGISVIFFGCSSKSSDEACRHQTTMDLDHGGYDAVISSGCADSMQKGAAYFGKAGFSINNVINNFSENGSENNNNNNNNTVQSNQTTTNNPLASYMNDLVKKVDSNSLSSLDSAKTEYDGVLKTSDSYRDAQFYISLVDAVKSLSLLKIILDGDGNGLMSKNCDMNSNNKPDEVDAISCGFYTAANQSCNTIANTNVSLDHSGLTLTDNTGTYGFTFRGLVITVSGSGASADCPKPNEYMQLLHSLTVVATVPGTPACHGSDGRTWPCPIIQNGQPLDLVTTIDASLTSAVSSMNTALQPISGTTVTQSDVQTSLNDIKKEACPSTGGCTSADIANYLQTYK